MTLLVRLAVLLALALVMPARADIAESDAVLTVTVDEQTQNTFAGEMVLITIHGAYRKQITLESMRQPDLEGFDWMQLGEDRWYRTQERGIEVLNLERRMALFPRRSGQIEIAPFVHELNMLDSVGTRFEHEAVSNALSLQIAPRPDGDGWWFPVRDIRVNDEWSNPPEQLDTGGGALRIITVTAHGIAPEKVPPMPRMTGAGVHIFPHPEKRIVTLGPNGPQTRTFWRWTIRPEGNSAGFINPITISYYDTLVREPRSITLSAQRVAYRNAVGQAEAGSDTAVPGTPGAEPGAVLALPAIAVPQAAVPAVAVLAAVAGLGVLGAGGLRTTATPSGAPLWRRILRVRLWLAAMRADAAAVWRHGRALLGPGTERALSRRLDALVYAPSPPAREDIRATARAVLAASRRNPVS